MSPRSEEFIDQAFDRLAAAREALDANHRGVAVSVAYYSMLYAARGDYSAVTPSEEEAERYVQGAADFLAAVEQMRGDGGPSARVGQIGG